MAIALNYSIKNIRNDVRQIFDEKSQFNSLVWGSLTLAPIKPPIVDFWLYHNEHCTEKIVFTVGSVSAERVGQGEVGVVTRMVLCTW